MVSQGLTITALYSCLIHFTRFSLELFLIALHHYTLFIFNDWSFHRMLDRCDVFEFLQALLSLFTFRSYARTFHIRNDADVFVDVSDSVFHGVDSDDLHSLSSARLIWNFILVAKGPNMLVPHIIVLKVRV
jgi:hypothetical protein